MALSNATLVLSFTKIIKQFNISISTAEDNFYSDVTELLKHSKLTVKKFDSIKKDLNRIFKENACQLKLFPISTGSNGEERLLSYNDVFNEEPFKNKKFKQSLVRPVPEGFTDMDRLICADLRTAYNKLISSRIKHLRKIVCSFSLSTARAGSGRIAVARSGSGALDSVAAAPSAGAGVSANNDIVYIPEASDQNTTVEGTIDLYDPMDAGERTVTVEHQFALSKKIDERSLLVGMTSRKSPVTLISTSNFDSAAVKNKVVHSATASLKRLTNTRKKRIIQSGISLSGNKKRKILHVAAASSKHLNPKKRKILHSAAASLKRLHTSSVKPTVQILKGQARFKQRQSNGSMYDEVILVESPFPTLDKFDMKVDTVLEADQIPDVTKNVHKYYSELLAVIQVCINFFFSLSLNKIVIFI